jgi:hypothetical protein
VAAGSPAATGFGFPFPLPLAAAPLPRGGTSSVVGADALPDSGWCDGTAYPPTRAPPPARPLLPRCPREKEEDEDTKALALALLLALRRLEVAPARRL